MPVQKVIEHMRLRFENVFLCDNTNSYWKSKININILFQQSQGFLKHFSLDCKNTEIVSVTWEIQKEGFGH